MELSNVSLTTSSFLLFLLILFLYVFSFSISIATTPIYLLLTLFYYQWLLYFDFAIFQSHGSNNFTICYLYLSPNLRIYFYAEIKSLSVLFVLVCFLFLFSFFLRGRIENLSKYFYEINEILINIKLGEIDILKFVYKNQIDVLDYSRVWIWRTSDRVRWKNIYIYVYTTLTVNPNNFNGTVAYRNLVVCVVTWRSICSARR